MRSSKLVNGFILLFVFASLTSLPIQLSARSVQPRSSQLIARAEQITGDRFRISTSTPRESPYLRLTRPALKSWPPSIGALTSCLQ